jgi:hypothetical protein
MNVNRSDVVFVVSLILFVVLLVFGGSWVVVTVSGVLSTAFPVLRGTVFGFNVVIAIASFLVITALNIYMRVLNKVITGKFYEKMSIKEWIRDALRENRHIILRFIHISIVISTIIAVIEYGTLRNLMFVPVFGVYQDVVISWVITFTVFELWVVTIFIIFYDLMK